MPASDKQRPLTEHQFATLAVLARKPDEYRLAWAGCGCSAFGFGEDPADREGCRELILSIPKKYRWPCTNTVKSLQRRGLIRQVGKTPYFFYTIFVITEAGLAAYKSDPAYDGPPEQGAHNDA